MSPNTAQITRPSRRPSMTQTGRAPPCHLHHRARRPCRPGHAGATSNVQPVPARLLTGTVTTTPSTSSLRARTCLSKKGECATSARASRALLCGMRTRRLGKAHQCPRSHPPQGDADRGACTNRWGLACLQRFPSRPSGHWNAGGVCACVRCAACLFAALERGRVPHMTTLHDAKLAAAHSRQKWQAAGPQSLCWAGIRERHFAQPNDRVLAMFIPWSWPSCSPLKAPKRRETSEA